MKVMLRIKDDVYAVVQKVAELEKKSVPEFIEDGIRAYLQGALDNELSNYFDIDTCDYKYPILEE